MNRDSVYLCFRVLLNDKHVGMRNKRKLLVTAFRKPELICSTMGIESGITGTAPILFHLLSVFDSVHKQQGVHCSFVSPSDLSSRLV